MSERALRKTHLLHDTSLPLRESNVTTRLVLDEFDIDLPPLAPRLAIVIVVVVVLSDSATLRRPVLVVAVALAGKAVVETRRSELVVATVNDLVGHSNRARLLLGLDDILWVMRLDGVGFTNVECVKLCWAEEGGKSGSKEGASTKLSGVRST